MKGILLSVPGPVFGLAPSGVRWQRHLPKIDAPNQAGNHQSVYRPLQRQLPCPDNRDRGSELRPSERLQPRRATLRRRSLTREKGPSW
jgi:hypothetical protein